LDTEAKKTIHNILKKLENQTKNYLSQFNY
jgi:hypothetical protein